MATRTSLTKLDQSLFKRTDEGYLQAKVNPTRIGVFAYYDAESGKVIKELRPPDEVAKADSLTTLHHKVATDDHPPALLTARTTKKYQSGHVSADHVMDADGIHTLSEVVITDGDLIGKIEAGKQQVSCGYTCDVEDSPGIWNGERYDRIQRNIKYNHLAIVHKGRAGSARLRTDAAPAIRFDAWEVDPDAPDTDSPTPAPDQGGSRADHESPSRKENRPMPTTRIDNREFECSEALQIALENKFKADAAALEAATKAAEQARADADKARTDAEAAKTQAQKDYDALQAKFDAAEEKALSPEALAKIVNERADALTALRTQAATVLGKDFKFDGLDEAAIKRAVVAKAKPDLKLDGQSEAYIAARFDIAIEDAQATPRTPVLDALDSARPRQDADFWQSTDLD
jgi:hypothetical protein